MLTTQGNLLKPSILNKSRILIVDNDRDCGALYTVLFESYGVAVVVAASVKEALDLLNRFVPDVLICETRFFGESVYPLIQQIRTISQKRQKSIPVFVTSTFPAMNLTDHLKVKVEAYQAKPLDLDQFVDQICSLLLLAKITQPVNIYDWLTKMVIGQTFRCGAGVH